MKQCYISEVIRSVLNPTDDYTYDNRIRPGQVLHVTHVCAYWDGILAAENIYFLVRDMGRNLYLGEDYSFANEGHPFLNINVNIGEGDQMGVYHPDSTTNDIIHLIVCGVLYDVDTWHNR